MSSNTLRHAGRFIQSILDGTAPREPNGCILWPYSTFAGYARGWWNGQAVHVGHVVLYHFVGPRPLHHTMGHAPHDVCGNRHCVAPEHLSWQTRAEQIENKRADGTMIVGGPPKGEAHFNSRTSDEDVRRAIQRVANGETQASVARDLGISRSTVTQWVRGVNRALT